MAEILSWHRVGQRVVCVGSPRAPRLNPTEKPPVKGETYTIRLVIPEDEFGPVTFHLVEIVNPPDLYIQGHEEVSFDARYFRPIKETSIESLRALLTPTPDAKREVFEEIIGEMARG